MSKSKEKFISTDVNWRHLPKETREITSFFNLIIDETIESVNEDFAPTYIRCIRNKCHGIIETAIYYDLDETYWRCTKCQNSGIIKNIFGN